MITYNHVLTSDEYNHLRDLVGWGPISDAAAKRGIEHTTFLVTARDGDKAVGMGRVLFDFGYTAYIGDIVVDPEYQGQGIGKSIVQRLMDSVMDAAEEGDVIMFVLAAAKGKEGFYQKLGFEVRPNDFDGPGMTRWWKKK